MGAALAIAVEVLGFVWENRQSAIDMAALVTKALGLTESSTPAELADLKAELEAAKARRQANNARIDDTSRDV